MAQSGYTPIQLYYSSTTTNVPLAANLASGELAINITDGKLFYKDNANAVQVIAWKVTPTTAGGTGLTSYTAGDLPYYASGTALSKLGIGASGNYLSSSGTAPQWSAPAALTKTDDTNVTLTLGGSASTALLNAASITAGWSGQLSAARGGTGIGSYTSGDMLYASGASTISKLGIGTSNQILTSSGSAPQWSTGITVSTLTWGTKLLLSGNGSTPGASELAIGTNGAGSRLVYNVATGGEHDFSVNGSVCIALNNSLLVPVPDNALTLGSASNRWSVVYAATALINTSDARTKQQVLDLTVAEQNVAKRIKGLIKTFKFNDAVQAKGDNARIHVGVVAQDVKAAFEAEGLDPNKYALFCHDSWEDKFEDIYEDQEITNADGVTETVSVNTGRQKQVLVAGDRFGVRYEELLAFVIAAM